MKVSFDFDSTLSKRNIQAIAKRFIKAGDDVYITTTRLEYKKGMDVKFSNTNLFLIAEKLGIPKENIRFTNYEDKVGYLENFDIHFDDDPHEIDLITRSNLKCLGILVNYKDYSLDKHYKSIDDN